MSLRDQSGTLELVEADRMDEARALVMEARFLVLKLRFQLAHRAIVARAES